ncbi:PAB-dependent poly(A)-specific ribonuclease subunit 2 [Trichinella spiralis]|uniref:PAB-dependent poly(A)-specific ribonuclease subunit 2 n=1 Tax=Trichinella spiralis TaxID=6334 RepID=UPI0001EFD097|nr:PAB-dependent poly(A)-specific ribonuclease subunit 2 [Trichinella spiralis]
MYSELVCAMENFSTEYQYPAILIRLTRSTTAAAYDGKVTFKLDKLTEATKVLTFGWLFSPTNPFDRNEKKFSIDQSKTQQQQQQQRASLDSCNWNPMTRSRL